jgi:hypothetical protein
LVSIAIIVLPISVHLWPTSPLISALVREIPVVPRIIPWTLRILPVPPLLIIIPIPTALLEISTSSVCHRPLFPNTVLAIAGDVPELFALVTHRSAAIRNPSLISLTSIPTLVADV